MSQVLTVPTHFNDLGELSEGFLDRVEQDTLILYGPVAYEDGSEIEFVVLLADGSAALEGVGRVRAAVDGGDDRLQETRYDVVVEALQFDGRSEVVFESLVLARQAVSDHPPEDDAAPAVDMNTAPADDDASDEPVLQEVELSSEDAFSVPPDEVYSLAPEDAEPETVPPDEDAPDTVPPDVVAQDDDDAYEEEPATVIAAVDAEAMMAEAEAELATASEPAPESMNAFASESVPASEAVTVAGSEPAPQFVDDDMANDDDDISVETVTSEAPGWDEAPAAELADDLPAAEASEDDEGGFDSEFAFQNGIAEEPMVGMPVPIPSMAAPPETPPAPPTLRLAVQPEGLTRPSLVRAEEASFTVDGEVSDVHTTGLFAYENGLPIPSRPPLPDPNRPASVRPVEATADFDVEDSEPPEASDDDYEEVRLSDFAEAAEEG